MTSVKMQPGECTDVANSALHGPSFSIANAFEMQMPATRSLPICDRVADSTARHAMWADKIGVSIPEQAVDMINSRPALTRSNNSCVTAVAGSSLRMASPAQRNASSN
eukprot:5431595-Pyramimonas_sp.AAC.1